MSFRIRYCKAGEKTLPKKKVFTTFFLLISAGLFTFFFSFLVFLFFGTDANWIFLIFIYYNIYMSALDKARKGNARALQSFADEGNEYVYQSHPQEIKAEFKSEIKSEIKSDKSYWEADSHKSYRKQGVFLRNQKQGIGDQQQEIQDKDDQNGRGDEVEGDADQGREPVEDENIEREISVGERVAIAINKEKEQNASQRASKKSRREQAANQQREQAASKRASIKSIREQANQRLGSSRNEPGNGENRLAGTTRMHMDQTNSINGVRNRSFSQRGVHGNGRKININQTNVRPILPPYVGRGNDSSSSSSSDQNHRKPWGNVEDWNFEKKNPTLNTQTKLYQPGQFSQFATKQEQKQSDLTKYINKIVSQALESHFQALKKFIQTEEKLDKRAKLWQKDFVSLFKTSQMMKQFIKNPIQSSLLELALNDGSAETSMKQEHRMPEVLNIFIKRLIRLSDFAVVENKIINLREYNFNEYMRDQLDNFYVKSIYHQNTLLKIDKTSTPTLVFLSNNKIMNRKDLMELNRSEREIIIDMVYRFLVSKDIMISKQEIFNLVAQKLTQLMQRK